MPMRIHKSGSKLSQGSSTIYAQNVGVIGDNAQIGEIHFHVEPPANARERRHRAEMLKLVHNIWIKGVLEQSLHGAVLLELGMEPDPNAVDHPWEMMLRSDWKEDFVPPGTKIIDVFDRMGSSLLILGSPGSGKTTTLLELTRQYLERAKEDETTPIPIVLNLSSWAEKKLPFAGWLVEELRTKYQVPKKIARSWVESDVLLLLLDGLDEVRSKQRDACVQAINTFRDKHLVPLVVCCRSDDYDALGYRLRFRSAITLQPLMLDQVDAYLAQAGLEYRAVRATLQHDVMLQEMASSPLLLNIMVLAYRNAKANIFRNLDTIEDRRKHLLDTYIVRVFQHRKKEPPFPKKHIVRWLSWLAKKMTLWDQPTFLLDGLQSDWLPKSSQGSTKISVLAIFASIYMLMCGGILIFNSIESNEVFMSALIGLSFILSEWFNSTIPAPSWSWRRVWRTFIASLITVCILGGIQITSYVISAPNPREILQFFITARWQLIPFSLMITAIPSTIVGLLEGYKGGIHKVHLLENIKWSWRNAFKGCLLGLICPTIGIALMLMGTMFIENPFSDPSDWLLFPVLVLMAGAQFFPFFVPIFVLIFGLRGATIDTHIVPNQRIRRSTRNFVFYGGLMSLLLFFLDKFDGTGMLVNIAPIAALLFFGGKPVIIHYTIRSILADHNYAPLNYIRFLNYCVDRILLRRVGNGYIFIHRLLQEHFAAMTSEDIVRITKCLS